MRRINKRVKEGQVRLETIVKLQQDIAQRMADETQREQARLQELSDDLKQLREGIP